MGVTRVRFSVLLAAIAQLGGCQAEDLKAPGPIPDLGICFVSWHAIVFFGISSYSDCTSIQDYFPLATMAMNHYCLSKRSQGGSNSRP